MSRYSRVFEIALALALLVPAAWSVDVPALLHYQAQLLDEDGEPVEGVVDVEIGIWDREVGGSELYNEEHFATPLVDGIFSVFLGDGVVSIGQIDPDLFDGDERWLALRIDGEPLVPRRRFVSTPYVLRAQQADRALEADSVGGVAAEDVASTTGAVFTGPIVLRGANGEVNARVTSVPGHPSHGLVAVSDADGNDLATMSVDADGQGRLAVLDDGGNELVEIGSEEIEGGDGGGAIAFRRRPGVVRTFGANATLNTHMGSGGIAGENRGRVAVYDEEGASRGSMTVNSTGQGVLALQGANGSLNARILADSGTPDLGRLAVHDSSGHPRFVASVTEGNRERVELFAPSGDPNVRLGGGTLNSERGEIFILDQGDVAAVRLGVDDIGGVAVFLGDIGVGATLSGNGEVTTLGRNGSANARLGGRPDSTDHGQVAVSDADGNDRGVLFVDSAGQGALRLNDADGNQRIDMSVTALGAGFIQARGSDGSSNIRLTSLSSDPDQGFLSIQNGDDRSVATMFSDANGRGGVQITDEDGGLAAVMGVSSSGTGFVSTLGENGSENVRLSSPVGSPDLGSIAVADDLGETRALMEVIPVAGAGLVATLGANGRNNVRLTALTQNANHGFVSVHDGNGEAQALMLVDPDGQGRIIADLKNFVVDHPTRPGKKIVYASLEGPEAAMYHRGVVTLENGEATIELPEHFAVLAVPDSITVQLTPCSLDSLGVAVDAVDGERIEIAELDGGVGNYDVHYLVHAVRRGFEDFQPVVSDEAYAGTSGSIDPSPAYDGRVSSLSVESGV